MEETYVLTNMWMDKEDVKYYSTIKKNESLFFVTTWMDLEGAILSEISQTERNKPLYNFTYLWNLTKQE